MMTKAKIDITVLAPEKKDGWPDKRRWDKMDGKWLVMTTATPHKPLKPIHLNPHHPLGLHIDISCITQGYLVEA